MENMLEPERVPPERGAAPASPFERGELIAALRSPLCTIDVLLTQKDRWMATVDAGHHRAAMAALLVLSSLLFSLPYALVLSPTQPLRVAALFGGSTLICLPSLHVVSAYLGLRIQPAQTFAAGAISPAVASIFAFGFAPILWFLRATIDADNSTGSIPALSAALLTASALAGAAHMVRCVNRTRVLSQSGWALFLMLSWLGLLLFIMHRMAGLLDLR